MDWHNFRASRKISCKNVSFNWIEIYLSSLYMYLCSVHCVHFILRKFAALWNCSNDKFQFWTYYDNLNVPNLITDLLFSAKKGNEFSLINFTKTDNKILWQQSLRLIIEKNPASKFIPISRNCASLNIPVWLMITYKFPFFFVLWMKTAADE